MGQFDRIVKPATSARPAVIEPGAGIDIGQPIQSAADAVQAGAGLVVNPRDTAFQKSSSGNPKPNKSLPRTAKKAAKFEGSRRQRAAHKAQLNTTTMRMGADGEAYDLEDVQAKSTAPATPASPVTLLNGPRRSAPKASIGRNENFHASTEVAARANYLLQGVPAAARQAAEAAEATESERQGMIAGENKFNEEQKRTGGSLRSERGITYDLNDMRAEVDKKGSPDIATNKPTTVSAKHKQWSEFKNRMVSEHGVIPEIKKGSPEGESGTKDDLRPSSIIPTAPQLEDLGKDSERAVGTEITKEENYGTEAKAAPAPEAEEDKLAREKAEAAEKNSAQLNEVKEYEQKSKGRNKEAGMDTRADVNRGTQFKKPSRVVGQEVEKSPGGQVVVETPMKEFSNKEWNRRVRESKIDAGPESTTIELHDLPEEGTDIVTPVRERGVQVTPKKPKVISLPNGPLTEAQTEQKEKLPKTVRFEGPRSVIPDTAMSTAVDTEKTDAELHAENLRDISNRMPSGYSGTGPYDPNKTSARPNRMQTREQRAIRASKRRTRAEKFGSDFAPQLHTPEIMQTAKLIGQQTYGLSPEAMAHPDFHGHEAVAEAYIAHRLGIHNSLEKLNTALGGLTNERAERRGAWYKLLESEDRGDEAFKGAGDVLRGLVGGEKNITTVNSKIGQGEETGVQLHGKAIEHFIAKQKDQSNRENLKTTTMRMGANGQAYDIEDRAAKPISFPENVDVSAATPTGSSKRLIQAQAHAGHLESGKNVVGCKHCAALSSTQSRANAATVAGTFIPPKAETGRVAVRKIDQVPEKATVRSLSEEEKANKSNLSGKDDSKFRF